MLSRHFCAPIRIRQRYPSGLPLGGGLFPERTRCPPLGNEGQQLGIPARLLLALLLQFGSASAAPLRGRKRHLSERLGLGHATRPRRE